MKQLLVLTKMNLVYFVMVCGLAGYGLAFSYDESWNWLNFLMFLFGLLFITMGSFAFNQFQERNLDSKMPRTKNRPLVKKSMSPMFAVVLAVVLISLGSYLLKEVEPVAAIFGLLTVLMYNGFYTLIWKPKWVFGAVPGAIPGAMPFVIGYAAAKGSVLSLECAYGFMIMFLWQMPHFWAIAMKFKDDYKYGGIPVMPSELGNEKAIMHIVQYTVIYCALAIVSPLFVDYWYCYIFAVIPFSVVVLYQARKFLKSKGESNWLGFFLSVNFSMLTFLLAPVGDRWLYILFMA